VPIVVAVLLLLGVVTPAHAQGTLRVGVGTTLNTLDPAKTTTLCRGSACTKVDSPRSTAACQICAGRAAPADFSRAAHSPSPPAHARKLSRRSRGAACDATGQAN
jgi:hypothetical protein